MPNLGLGSNLSNVKSGGLITPGIVTSNLVLKHKYDAGSVIPVSDGAVLFDGTNDYINCGSDSSIDMGTSAFSVTCWVYLNVIGDLCLVGKGPSITTEDSGWSVSVYNNGRAYLDLNNSGRDATYSTVGAITANQWYHIAVVRAAADGAGRNIYIDGVENTESNQSFAISDAGDASIDLWFGDVPTGGSRELDGCMCNVGIWKDRVLTQPEIKSIMNKNYAGLTTGTGGETENLVSWWNLDEGTGTTANDSHGSNTGTATNF